MITTYEQYLEKTKSLSFEQMNVLHKMMLEELKELIEIEGDDEVVEIYDELIQTAAKYAEFRQNWLVWDRETRIERDSSRTSCHNSLIVKFNMLARYLKLHGKTAKWRDELGYEEDDRYNRKTVGDFGCYLAFINGINAR